MDVIRNVESDLNLKELHGRFTMVSFNPLHSWRMKDEGWRIKDEGWRMKDEGWRMKGIGWRMKHEVWRMKDEELGMIYHCLQLKDYKLSQRIKLYNLFIFSLSSVYHYTTIYLSVYLLIYLSIYLSTRIYLSISRKLIVFCQIYLYLSLSILVVLGTFPKAFSQGWPPKWQLPKRKLPKG